MGTGSFPPDEYIEVAQLAIKLDALLAKHPRISNFLDGRTQQWIEATLLEVYEGLRDGRRSVTPPLLFVSLVRQELSDEEWLMLQDTLTDLVPGEQPQLLIRLAWQTVLVRAYAVAIRGREKHAYNQALEHSGPQEANESDPAAAFPYAAQPNPGTVARTEGTAQAGNDGEEESG